MPHFYVPSFDEANKEEFIKRYGQSYYLGEKRIVPRVTQSSRFVEDEMDRLLEEGIQDEVDVAHILAWKLGKVKHADSEKAGAFRYASDWADAENLKAKRYGRDFDLKRIASYVVKHKASLEELAHDNPQEVLECLRDAGTDGLGTVYMVTLLHFISRGEYPIYDRFAAMALYAIENGIRPGGKVEYEELPDKGSRRFDSVVRSSLVPYRERLEAIFGEGCCRKRNVDRALWVYGHWFQVK